MNEAAPLLPDVLWCQHAYEVATDCDAVVLITEWNEFRALDLDQLGSVMRSRVLVDLRNVYRPQEAVAHGFSYTGIGRGHHATPIATVQPIDRSLPLPVETETTSAVGTDHQRRTGQTHSMQQGLGTHPGRMIARQSRSVHIEA